MEQTDKQTHTWQANYYFRTKTLATRKLKEFETMGIKPNHTDRKVKKYTLRAVSYTHLTLPTNREV